MRVAGDSMTPRFVDRQIIYVKQQQTLDEGEIGVFMLTNIPEMLKQCLVC